MAESKPMSFLQELYTTRLQYTISDKGVNDLKESVDKIIGNIATKLSKLANEFEISHRCLAGSMAEETSIHEPNEFDYLLVLKHLSQPGAIEIQNQLNVDSTCYTDVNFEKCLIAGDYGDTNQHAHIKPGNPAVASLFSSYIEHGYIGNFKLNLKFNECVISVVKDMEQVRGKMGILSTESSDESGEGCASTFNLLWTPSDLKLSKIHISIDLVPAIEIHGIEAACLDPDMKAYNDRLVEHNKYLIVPGKLAHKCFLYTFTKTEVSIVRSLSEKHKTCYMLLKYLLRIIVGGTNVITSYMAKTFVLRHSVNCTNDVDLYYCIYAILENIKTSFGTLYKDQRLQYNNIIHTDVRCIFMNSNFISKHLYDGRETHAIVDALIAIQKRLHDIREEEKTLNYDFESCFQRLDKFVIRLKQKRYVLKMNFDEYQQNPNHSLPIKMNDYDNNM